MARARIAPSTAYQQHRFLVRFEQFRREDPARPLAAAVQTWLGRLPVSQQRTARDALKRALGKTALDWSELEVARYHRNQLNLAASVLRESDRARGRAAAHGPQELALIESLWVVRRAEAAARWSGATSICRAA